MDKSELRSCLVKYTIDVSCAVGLFVLLALTLARHGEVFWLYAYAFGSTGCAVNAMLGARELMRAGKQ